MKRFNLSIGVDLFNRLEDESDRTGLAKSGVVIAALDQYFSVRDAQPVMKQLQEALEKAERLNRDSITR
ncbi:hypothetical protein [Lacticaseibacillus paracasei]|uniref:hypothetical protein n=1 Tax=Lacticaseibacillus paracasei TaxID=1597 RepID=UPI002A5A6ACA|nr:hypothetical protein [Lacticaseibacillus paracasei]MDY0839711.1 hypothetical protein [Lacticaseibacillus paracasei]